MSVYISWHVVVVVVGSTFAVVVAVRAHFELEGDDVQLMGHTVAAVVALFVIDRMTVTVSKSCDCPRKDRHSRRSCLCC